MATTQWNVIEAALGEGHIHVLLAPIPGGADDDVFWNDTPEGRLQIIITNPASADLFTIGQVWNVEVTPAP